MKSAFIVPSRINNFGKPRLTYAPFIQFRHEGKQYRWATHVSVPASLWLKKGLSTDLRKIKEAGWTPMHVTDTNARLDQLQAKLTNLYAEELLGDELDIKAVKKAWEDYRDGKKHKRKKQQKPKGLTLQDMILQCIKYKQNHPQATTVNKKPISKATLSNYMQMLDAVIAFDKLNNVKTRIAHVNLKWYYGFVTFLGEHLKLTGSTPGKLIRNLKTALKWADVEGLKVCTDYRRPEFCEPQTDDDSEPMDAVLTWDEIAQLRKIDLTGTAEIARDLFCLSCYTAMRAGDLERLDKVRIVQGKRGKSLQWKPQKAKARTVTVPMRREIREIYERWSGFPPSLSAQAINNHIKQICKAAGFTNMMEGAKEVNVTVLGKQRRRKVIVKQPRHDLVTCHSGRRSFCTNWFDDLAKFPMLSVEQIMRWSGHKKRDPFFLYINREPISDGDAGFDFVD